MFIILSQRIDYLSDYEDIPFNIYHYPKVYRNQIKSGDLFIYYQGDSKSKENRYYYGCGVIGEIIQSKDGESFYAEILKGIKFPKKVPIYFPNGGYYEKKENKANINIKPAWQRSIRKTSEISFNTILEHGELNPWLVKEILILNYKQKLNETEIKYLKNKMNKLL